MRIEKRLSQTFKDFADSGKAGGVVLIVCRLVSLAIANSPVGEGYLHFWHLHVVGLSVEHWINDALMAVFFLLIGLELERELYNGELSDLRNALLPILAAAGGIAVPALIHFGLLGMGEARACRPGLIRRGGQTVPPVHFAPPIRQCRMDERPHFKWRNCHGDVICSRFDAVVTAYWDKVALPALHHAETEAAFWANNNEGGAVFAHAEVVDQQLVTARCRGRASQPRVGQRVISNAPSGWEAHHRF
jgi:hypothetical protein